MRDDERTEEYLFDPAAAPDEEVVRLEAALAPLRYDSDAHPLPDRRRLARRRPRMLLAAAAAMLLAFVAAGALWLWTWPSDRPWSVVAGPLDALPIGRPVSTGSDDSLLVRVARIGWMRIGRDSEVTLLSTRSNQHRLVMQEGTLHVSVWAPPRSIAIRTPSGEVIDFGCEFIVRVDRDLTTVDVVSGWVRLDNDSGEVLVPGGASSVMRRDGLPSVPLFRSATPGFKSAIRS
ncbi:MAG TPA: FecR domain-containing protein, partial [Thermoanaerobaculia bacterium]|nr:FecR domain-containing protein [Thermoanaerobaculia bacterium]